MTAINFTVMQDKVEDGSKCRTYRLAKCLNEKVNCHHFKDVEHGVEWTGVPDCYFGCGDYKPRIKLGGKLQLYTGLRQRKYCKIFGMKPKIGITCPLDYSDGAICYKGCGLLGAKLLRTSTCVNTYPIKFEDLTEEDARLDGFEDKLIKNPNHNPSDECWKSPLDQLKEFLIKAYDAKPDTVFQAIIWEA